MLVKWKCPDCGHETKFEVKGQSITTISRAQPLFFISNSKNKIYICEMCGYEVENVN